MPGGQITAATNERLTEKISKEALAQIRKTDGPSAIPRLSTTPPHNYCTVQVEVDVIRLRNSIEFGQVLTFSDLLFSWGGGGVKAPNTTVMGLYANLVPSSHET